MTPKPKPPQTPHDLVKAWRREAKQLKAEAIGRKAGDPMTPDIERALGSFESAVGNYWLADGQDKGPKAAPAVHRG